jgi:hypothetical protein
MTIGADWAARAIPGAVAGWGTPANSAGHLSGGGVGGETSCATKMQRIGAAKICPWSKAGTNSPSGQSRHGQVIEMAGAPEEIRTPDPRFVVWSRRQFPLDVPIFDQGNSCDCPQSFTHVYRARVGHQRGGEEKIQGNLLISLALPSSLSDLTANSLILLSRYHFLEAKLLSLFKGLKISMIPSPTGC